MICLIFYLTYILQGFIRPKFLTW